MNERFIFIPSIAFSLVCAWTLVQYGWYSEKPVLKWGAVARIVILAGGYAFKTYTRVPAWKDALSLNGSAAVSARLEVVNLKQASNFVLMHSAIAAAATETSPNLFSDLC